MQQAKSRILRTVTQSQKRTFDLTDESKNRNENIRKRVAGLPYSPAPQRDQAPVHLDVGK